MLPKMDWQALLNFWQRKEWQTSTNKIGFKELHFIGHVDLIAAKWQKYF
jgi:hypothetical protein